MTEHCGRAKEHVDSHTSGRWEPVKISFKRKIFCYFSVKKKKTLETLCYFIHVIRDRKQQLSKSWYHTLKPITQTYRMSLLSLWINYKFLKTVTYNGSADTTLTTAANALLL